MDVLEARAVYEISKLTNVSKQIMDNFLSSAIMAIFKQYISSYDKPEVALFAFMESWEDNILEQKEEEINAISEQHGSMSDMVVGQKLIEAEDMDDFSEEVMIIKEMISEALLESLKMDDDKQ